MARHFRKLLGSTRSGLEGIFTPKTISFGDVPPPARDESAGATGVSTYPLFVDTGMTGDPAAPGNAGGSLEKRFKALMLKMRTRRAREAERLVAKQAREKRQEERLKTEALSRRIQALPQELQDIILDFVLSVPPNDDGVVYISDAYKPPTGLQLNRKIRARFAKAYYGGDAIFLVERPLNLEFRLWCFPRLERWFSKLEFSHSELINTIRMEINQSLPPYDLDFWLCPIRSGVLALEIPLLLQDERHGKWYRPEGHWV